MGDLLSDSGLRGFGFATAPGAGFTSIGGENGASCGWAAAARRVRTRHPWRRSRQSISSKCASG